MTGGTTVRLEPFDQQGFKVLGQLRAAVASAIATIPGGIKRAADLQKATDLDAKLSWRMFKVAHAPDPLSAGPYVPNPSSIRTFLEAASRVGVREDLLTAIETASDDFEQFVTAHAGDRDTFDSMISALAQGEDVEHANLRQRRSAFRANRHIWGLQATTQVRCVFTDVGDDPARVNVVMIDGYVALRQLRRDAPMIVSRARVADDRGNPLPVDREPIDPGAVSEHGISLFRDFCSTPTPQLREVQAAAGFVYGELVSSGVGNRGAITCFTGWRARNVAGRYRAPNNMQAIVHGAVRVPCESITICMLTRTGLFEGATPELAVYSDHMAELPYPIRTHRMDKLLLPDERVMYLGRGANTLCSPEIPQLANLAQAVFDRLGWDGDQFEVHRCTIAYPILPSTVAISTDLPEPPSA
jgi:hypothetical protein